MIGLLKNLGYSPHIDQWDVFDLPNGLFRTRTQGQVVQSHQVPLRHLLRQLSGCHPRVGALGEHHVCLDDMDEEIINYPQ